MTILFITNNLPPIVDGVGDYTFNIAQQFYLHGHDVTIVCRHDERINTDVEGITVFPIIKKWGKDAGKDIAKIIMQKNIDVVSLQYVPHGFHPKGLPFGLIGCLKEVKKTGAKLMTFAHEISLGQSAHGIKGRLLNFLMKRISSTIIKKSDVVATSIVEYKRRIKEMTGQDVLAIPIASNLPESQLSDEELTKLRIEVAKGADVVISFIGKREINNAVEAIEQLRKQGLKIQILFIGKTNGDNLERVDCYKTGVLDISDMDKYLKISEMMVLPQGRGGCSFKSGSLMAALRARIPVVSNKGFMTDPSLKDGENVVFTDFNSVDVVTNSLMSLINNKDLRERISYGAWQLSCNITWCSTYEQYISLLMK